MSESALQLLFGEVIRTRRTTQGLSQEELADQAGLHRTYIGLVERGKRMPSIEMVRRLALALSTTMTALVSLLEKRIREQKPVLLSQELPLPFHRIRKEKSKRTPRRGADRTDGSVDNAK
jgi:transcriptional regulator with XRE-family HTH domain